MVETNFYEQLNQLSQLDNISVSVENPRLKKAINDYITWASNEIINVISNSAKGSN